MYWHERGALGSAHVCADVCLWGQEAEEGQSEVGKGEQASTWGQVKRTW